MIFILFPWHMVTYQLCTQEVFYELKGDISAHVINNREWISHPSSRKRNEVSQQFPFCGLIGSRILAARKAFVVIRSPMPLKAGVVGFSLALQHRK
jgi:hypothetical protein